jgi:pimeloyl-ACP methyl ester carboxylesterase
MVLLNPRPIRAAPRRSAEYHGGAWAETTSRFLLTKPGGGRQAIQKTFPLIPDRAALHMAKHGTHTKGGRYRWKHDPILRYRTTTAMSEKQIEAFIRRLKCPILFVYGTESDFMKSVRGHRAQLFPNATIVPIEGAGHHIPHEKPVELAVWCRFCCRIK